MSIPLHHPVFEKTATKALSVLFFSLLLGLCIPRSAFGISNFTGYYTGAKISWGTRRRVPRATSSTSGAGHRARATRRARRIPMTYDV